MWPVAGGVGVETSEKWVSVYIQHLPWPKLAIRSVELNGKQQCIIIVQRLPWPKLAIQSVELNGKQQCIIIVQRLPWPKAAFVSVQGWW